MVPLFDNKKTETLVIVSQNVRQGTQIKFAVTLFTILSIIILSKPGTGYVGAMSKAQK